jgi:uncharacterized protein YgiM (DUF1202 family)
MTALEPSAPVRNSIFEILFRILLWFAFTLLQQPAEVHAAETPDAFARVIVSEAELRAGPGVSHRVIYRAERGEAFHITAREGTGFWLEVELADGRTAYVLGDTVERVAVGPDTEGAFSKPGFFAPPALQHARGGLAMMGGALDLDGYVELRPALVIAPAIAFEPYAGVALQGDARRVIYGGAGTLNLAPDWAIAPFVSLGIGGVVEEPKGEYRPRSRKWFHARVGGGLLVSLRWRVLLRLEASNFVFYTEDDYQNVQSYLGGLGTYF